MHIDLSVRLDVGRLAENLMESGWFFGVQPFAFSTQKALPLS